MNFNTYVAIFQVDFQLCDNILFSTLFSYLQHILIIPLLLYFSIYYSPDSISNVLFDNYTSFTYLLR